MKVLITPKSFRNYREKTYPLIERVGYAIIENTTGRTLTEDEIIELAKEDVYGIIIGVDPLSERVLRACKDLKAISKYGVGVDNIDLDTAKELGIKVRIASGSNSVSVAELAIAMMFEAARRITAMNASVKGGGWERFRGVELTGKTLGVVGGGQVGKEVARRAKGLCMNIFIFDPYFNDFDFLKRHGISLCDSLDRTLAVSDFVTLHIPLTEETRYIINAQTLKIMKPTSVLINTSRGGLVDEDSLYSALSKKEIAFAAEDVFSAEPPAAGEKLLTLDNFLLTPHAGAFTSEATEKMALYSTNNLLEMLIS